MKEMSNEDKKRLKELSEILKQIKNEGAKDQLIGAAKWAVISDKKQTA